MAEQLGARWVTPAKALTDGADVLAPCALGGVLDHESVPPLQVPIVAGAANNQLADDDDRRPAAERGILWAPDFVANAGGIINIAVELEPRRLRPRPRPRARRGHRRHAAPRSTTSPPSDGDTPFSAALALAQRRVDEA